MFWGRSTYFEWKAREHTVQKLQELRDYRPALEKYNDANDINVLFQCKYIPESKTLYATLLHPERKRWQFTSLYIIFAQ